MENKEEQLVKEAIEKAVISPCCHAKVEYCNHLKREGDIFDFHAHCVKCDADVNGTCSVAVFGVPPGANPFRRYQLNQKVRLKKLADVFEPLEIDAKLDAMNIIEGLEKSFADRQKE